MGYWKLAATNQYQGVGGLFFATNMGGTYDLNQIKVSCTNGKFPVPTSDYIQQLDPATTEVIARYTYVSKEYLLDYFEDDYEDEYENGVGWWQYVKGTSYASLIENGDYSMKCGATPIPVGTAFLGFLAKNKTFHFTSDGAVPAETTSYTVNQKQYPYFLNYLPANITLGDIVISCTGGKFPVPTTDYLQVLDPATTETIARYTYVSKAYLLDYFEDDYEEEYDNGVGWWRYVKGTSYASLIENGDYSMKCDATPVPAGQAYLGYLTSSKTFVFTFPDPTNVPSANE